MTRSRLAGGSVSRLDTIVSSGLADVSVDHFRNTVMEKTVNRKMFGPENSLNIKSENSSHGKYVSEKIFGGNWETRIPS